MLSSSALEGLWSREGRSRAIHPRPVFTERGLELGAETVIAPVHRIEGGFFRFAPTAFGERARTLLSVAYAGRITPNALDAVRRAAVTWSTGEYWMAYHLLDQIGLGPLSDVPLTAKCLFWVEKLIESGEAPEFVLAKLERVLADQPYGKAAVDDPKHPGWPAGTPDGKGGDFRPKDGSEVILASNSTPGVGHNGGPPLEEPPPEVPEIKPPSLKEVLGYARGAAYWLARRMAVLAAVAVAPEVGPVVAATMIDAQVFAEAGEWLEPYVRPYVEDPKTLDELQRAVDTPAEGTDIHHIVERSGARQDGFSREQIENPSNLARISRFRHWEINDWYTRQSKDYGNLTPREYLKGRSW